MNILDKIIAHKKLEVAEKSSLVPVKLLEQSAYFDSNVVSMKKYIKHEDKTGIIAEFKRKSPSKGAINTNALVETVSIGYMQAGASALSILTDKEFFGGKNEDLTTARKFNFCPILRKDFIIDEYQIIEAKSIGADCILLIAAALEPAKLKSLAAFAKESPSRSARTTQRPMPANALAVARPMPDAPPVTMKTLPLTSMLYSRRRLTRPRF